MARRAIHWNNTNVVGSGVALTDISKYLKRLRQYGIEFQRRRSTALNSENFSLVSYTKEVEAGGYSIDTY